MDWGCATVAKWLRAQANLGIHHVVCASRTTGDFPQAPALAIYQYRV
jgi:hypothetical protein